MQIPQNEEIHNDYIELIKLVQDFYIELQKEIAPNAPTPEPLDTDHIKTIYHLSETPDDYMKKVLELVVTDENLKTEILGMFNV